MKKNRSIIAGVIVSLVIGYFMGGMLGIPGVDSQLLNGDISKVGKSVKPVSEEAMVFQQRMQNDSTFRKETLATLSMIDSRVQQFRDLTDSTAIVAKGIKDLDETVAKISQMQEFAKKAQQQADEALSVLTAMSKGEKNVAADYEQLAQNTFIAYTLIDRQKEAARLFVDNVDTYLFNSSKNEALAKVRNEWVAFCGDGAILNDNNDDLVYWNKKAIMAKAGMTPLPKVRGLVFNLTKEPAKKDLADSEDILCTSAQ